MSTPVFRFAPSPNGFLHLGHAYSALLNFTLARETGGRFLLRIEDIDQGRARAEFEAAIYEDLAWLGLVWETPVRRQSEHFDDYARWPRDPDGAPLYPRICRDKPHRSAREILSASGVALRLDMQKAIALAGQGLSWEEVGLDDRVAADPAQWGDVVLARKDTPASYHLAVVVDDALQGVTDIVRGRDLYHATSVHRLLQRLLDLPEPCYRHHDLERDAHGEKLSKSRGSETLRDLREAGASAEEIRSRLGF